MNSETWNTIVASFPKPHILQTWQWGEIKSHFGWRPSHRVWGDEHNPAAAALILQREIPLAGFAARLRVLYAPKGPLLRDWGDGSLRQQVLDDLQALARQRGAIFLKIDPDVELGSGVPGEPEAESNPLGGALQSELQARGWRYSAEQIQFRNTVLIDLSASEDTILARMKQKTRYNIRLAGRKGVKARMGDDGDFGLLYRMYAETSLRDGFIIRGEAYYQTLWRTFFEAGMLDPLIAEVEGEPVGALMLYRHAGRAWYLHGMSREFHREKMPNYLLQWEAIRHAKATGCREYDLWGAPETFDESDAMWGVFRFKRGLSGEVARTLGAWDYPEKPFYYKLYTQTLPRILAVMRRRGKARIGNTVGD